MLQLSPKEGAEEDEDEDYSTNMSMPHIRFSRYRQAGRQIKIDF